MNAIEPLGFWLLDGREAKFLLNFAQIRRAAADVAASTETNAALGAIDTFGRTLYVAMLDKDEMTYEQFLEILPPDGDLLKDFFDALKEHCGVAQNDKYRRPRKSQTPTQ
jgi:hypothetical protein